jgi:hypothetical protein
LEEQAGTKTTHTNTHNTTTHTHTQHKNKQQTQTEHASLDGIGARLCRPKYDRQRHRRGRADDTVGCRARVGATTEALLAHGRRAHQRTVNLSTGVVKREGTVAGRAHAIPAATTNCSHDNININGGVDECVRVGDVGALHEFEDPRDAAAAGAHALCQRRDCAAEERPPGTALVVRLLLRRSFVFAARFRLRKSHNIYATSPTAASEPLDATIDERVALFEARDDVFNDATNNDDDDIYGGAGDNEGGSTLPAIDAVSSSRPSSSSSSTSSMLTVTQRVAARRALAHTDLTTTLAADVAVVEIDVATEAAAVARALKDDLRTSGAAVNDRFDALESSDDALMRMSKTQLDR